MTALRRRLGIWAAAAALILSSGVIWLVATDAPRQFAQTVIQSRGIGQPFNLVDHNGNPITEKAFEDKMTLTINKQGQMMSDILIFKTDLETEGKVREVEPILNTLPNISHWSVDNDDIDNVLRIVSSGSLEEHEVIKLVQHRGFRCETLTY